ncbi:MAG: HEAT repeat domain-containing protein [Candidatus Thorarchaeota archaeon]|nr:HEAT repeat domain-containing protein [Candidatus Thorarchaeota archaeon]
MSKKSDRALSESLGGGETLSRFRKAIKKAFKSSDDKIERMLEGITSIQACRDAALTGDEEQRILAICRLGQYGVDAFESLEIALVDENWIVRALAAGMLTYTRRLDAIPILERYTNDNNDYVKDTIDYCLEWLKKYGRDIPERNLVLEPRENTVELLFDTDGIPLRETDDVLVINDYETTPETLEYGITIKNEGKKPIHEVTVKILAYPRDGLEPVDELTQVIETIEPGDSGALIFGFSVTQDCIEGEIITSVQLIDDSGEDLSAKAGNVFVRSLFTQYTPVEMTMDEFIRLKSDMKQWNREHAMLSRASELFEVMGDLFERKNLHVFQNETIERDGAFMGVIAGIAEGKFSGKYLGVTITVVGNIGDKLSKLRIDIFAEDPEIEQSAASELFETLQTDLGLIEDNNL